MNNDDKYIQEKINHENIKLYLTSKNISLCLNYMIFNNVLIETYLTNEIRRIRSEKISADKKIKIKNSIVSLLKKQSFNMGITSRDVQNSLKMVYKDNTSELYKVSREIAVNPVDALIEYLNDYCSSARYLEQLEKELGTKKESKPEIKEENKDSKQLSDNYKSDKVNLNDFTLSRVEKKSSQPFKSTNDEDKKVEVDKKINSMISEEYKNQEFNLDEKRELLKIYPELELYGSSYYSVDTLVDGINIERIFNKKHITAHDMMILTSMTYEVMVKYLLDGSSSHLDDQLFFKYRIPKSLDKYKKIFNKWMKYYNNLTPSEKEAINKEIMSNKSYSSQFGSSILSYDELVSIINKTVSKEIVEDCNLNFNCNDMSFERKIIHASQYMDVNNLKKLYIDLKQEYNKYGIWAITLEDRELKSKALEETNINLQTKFSYIILKKLESYSNNIDFSELSEKEKIDYSNKQAKKIEAIIRIYLHENPLEERYSNLGTNVELNNIANNLIETYETKKNATTKVYGLSKVEKTLAKITGKWKKYVTLIEKDELSGQERNELAGMFNRR